MILQLMLLLTLYDPGRGVGRLYNPLHLRVFTLMDLHLEVHYYAPETFHKKWFYTVCKCSRGLVTPPPLPGR